MEPYAAMESPPSAGGSAFQLVLEHLWGALLLISGSWTHSPSSPSAFPWVMLVWTGLLVFLAKRRLTLRSAKALGQRHSARHDGCAAGSEDIGTTTQADDALRPPWLVACPPTLQALCLSAMNTDLSGLLCWDTLDFLEKAQKSQPPQQVTDEKPILRDTEKDREQLLRERTNDWSENTPLPERSELFNQEVSRWRQTRQEKEGEESLEPSNAHMEPGPKDQASQSASTAGPGLQAVPSPDLAAHHAGAGTCGVQQKRGAGNGHHPACQAAVPLEGVTDDAGFPVSPPSPDGQQQARATQPWAERAEIAVLTRRMHSLQTQEASLREENSKLDREIQQLKLKVQNVPEDQNQRILQLHRKMFRGEDRCLEMKKQLAGLYREMNFSCQVRNLYKKIGRELGEELERDACHYPKAVLFHQDRVAKSWVAAASSESKFEELRKENDRMRQMLACVESHCPPFLSDPLAPAAPPAAHRGWQVSGGPWAHQGPRKEGGPPGRAPNPGSPAGGTGFRAAGI